MVYSFYTFREGGINLNRLKEIREEKGFSISKLAKISGVTRQTIYRLENEEDESVKSKTLKSLAEALGVKVTDFFMD